MFSLAFFLCSRLPSSYVLARRTSSQACRGHLPQAIYLAEPNQQTRHQAVWGSLPGSHPQTSPSRPFLRRTDAYSSLLDKSDASIKQSGDVFLEGISRSSLADSSADLTRIPIFFADLPRMSIFITDPERVLTRVFAGRVNRAMRTR